MKKIAFNLSSFSDKQVGLKIHIINFGIDSNKLENYSNEIKNIQNLGIEIAIVIGGGNIYRGIESEKTGIDRVQGDYMGMLATVINCMALQSFLEKIG